MSDQQPGEGVPAPPADLDESIAIPLEWHIPEGMVSRYATNIVVQHSAHEFTVSFFEVNPPVILGSIEERKAALQQMGSVRAECIARIIIAPGRMPAFIKALQTNMEKHASTIKEQGQEVDE